VDLAIGQFPLIKQPTRQELYPVKIAQIRIIGNTANHYLKALCRLSDDCISVLPFGSKFFRFRGRSRLVITFALMVASATEFPEDFLALNFFHK